MAEFEDALASVEAQIAAAQKSAERLAKLLRRLVQAARTGNVSDLQKGLDQVTQFGVEAAADARNLSGVWRFDTSAYLASGFSSELKQAAAAAGIELIEKDDRIYAFPLMLRVAADQAGVRIGRRLERRIRPKVLAAQLAALLRKPQRLAEQRFLDLLYDVYQLVSGPEWRRLEEGGGPLLRLSDVHRLLTLLPGSDYSVEEFGRDLLLLSRRPELRARDGARFEFPGSALARESRATPIVIYDEEGRERSYLGLRFVKGG